MLKKNNVSIDVVNFANPDNVSRLQTLVDSANQGSDGEQTCHFMDVAPGCNITDVIISSPIIMSESPDMGAAGGDGGNAGAGGPDANMRAQLLQMGINPDTDPDLAQAVIMSLQDQN